MAPAQKVLCAPIMAGQKVRSQRSEQDESRGDATREESAVVKMQSRVFVSVVWLSIATGLLAAQTPQSPPSPPEVVTAMLKLAAVTKTDVVYDLGSGDGRIPIAAAKMYGARAVGVEIDAQLVKQAREKAQAESVADRVRFLQQDVFAADLSEATVVTIYLLPSLHVQLLPKLNRELKPGTRVVSESFDFGGPKPKATIDVSGRPVYLWVVPIR